ncbi:MAG: pantetheine-phosphate adenylyltransferase [Candidatus Gracilibacteria bacterium]|nr:pantetheine-phosphate adenylyltransferase [Candidatus Gracilibacteria bacterium]
MKQSKNTNYVIVAGSFDYLHIGHMELLKRAFAGSEDVLIGIMDDDYLSRKAKNFMPIRQRREELKNYLKRFHRFYRIMLLKDQYGSATTSEAMNRIIVSPETREVAEEINALREAEGLLALTIEEVPFSKDEKGQKLSSSNIRKGKIDRKGRYYLSEKLFKKSKILKIKPTAKLKKPWGPVFSKRRIENMFSKWKANEKIITVGDDSTKTFIKNGIIPQLAIVDNMVKRQKITLDQRVPFSKFDIMYKVRNEAGTVTFDLMKTLDSTLDSFEKRKQVILVKGEEDLATLGAILLAPMQSKLFYGQPDEGMVQVIVNEKLKQRAAEILRKGY